jgi:hypothetical protein
MADRIVTSIVFWILWTIAIIGQFTILYDVFSTQVLNSSQQAFAIFFFTLLPISYGYYSERQVV